jgi:hypothetical protein
MLPVSRAILYATLVVGALDAADGVVFRGLQEQPLPRASGRRVASAQVPLTCITDDAVAVNWLLARA